MIVVMTESATKDELQTVLKAIKDFGYTPHLIHGVERDVIGAVGDERGKAVLQTLENYSGVEKVVPILHPYKLASKAVKKDKSRIKVGNDVFIGGNQVVIIAGPCSVENEEQIVECAHNVKKSGARILRGGAFKPRTSPYSFQGMEEAGLKLLKIASEASGLPFVTEVMETGQVDLIADYADMLQVGARNIQNFALLKKLGTVSKPILLKRGLATNIEEFIMCAEYIMAHGNQNVVLCERGIRTFETATRNTLDLSAIPVLNEITHLPIVVDPSHATGSWKYVERMSLASVAAGADGVMIEVHPTPETAQSDGVQSLKPAKFEKLMECIKPVIEAVGRTL